jgi:hypothetical protein
MHAGIAGFSTSAINRLNPSVDSGWVIVTHHCNRDSCEGYVEALQQIQSTCEPAVHVRGQGFFTVTQRPPRDGCPDHLMIYSAELSRDGRASPFSYYNWSRAIGPDGNAVPWEVWSGIG